MNILKQQLWQRMLLNKSSRTYVWIPHGGRDAYAFMVNFKNRVMDLDNYREQSNPITDHEERT